MNTAELDRLISRYVKHFDGVFSSDRLLSNTRMLVSNTHPSDVSYTSEMMVITENFLTRLVVLLLLNSNTI